MVRPNKSQNEPRRVSTSSGTSWSSSIHRRISAHERRAPRDHTSQLAAPSSQARSGGNSIPKINPQPSHIIDLTRQMIQDFLQENRREELKTLLEKIEYLEDRIKTLLMMIENLDWSLKGRDWSAFW